MAKRWITHRAKARRYKKKAWRQRHKTNKKNYGSKMFRRQIEKEVFSGPPEYIINLSRLKDIEKRDPMLKGSKFVDDPRYGHKILIKTIEKNPELLKELRGKDIFFYEPKDEKTPLGFAKGRQGIIGINKRVLDEEIIVADPLTKSVRDYPLKDILKHEVAHLKQQKIDPYIKHQLSEVGADYAIHTDIRKEKPRKRIVDKVTSRFFSRGDAL